MECPGIGSRCAHAASWHIEEVVRLAPAVGDPRTAAWMPLQKHDAGLGPFGEDSDQRRHAHEATADDRKVTG